MGSMQIVKVQGGDRHFCLSFGSVALAGAVRPCLEVSDAATHKARQSSQSNRDRVLHARVVAAYFTSALKRPQGQSWRHTSGLAFPSTALHLLAQIHAQQCDMLIRPGAALELPLRVLSGQHEQASMRNG